MKLYVGNLSYNTTQETMRDHFAQYGEVSDAVILTDKFSGRSRGFGFVTMPNDDEANAAIEALNGQDFDGRSLVVNEARPRTDRR